MQIPILQSLKFGLVIFKVVFVCLFVCFQIYLIILWEFYGVKGRPARLFCNQHPCHQETVHNSLCNAVLFHSNVIKNSSFELQVMNCMKWQGFLWVFILYRSGYRLTFLSTCTLNCSVLSKHHVFTLIMAAFKKLRNSTTYFIEAKYSSLPWEFLEENGYTSSLI